MTTCGTGALNDRAGGAVIKRDGFRLRRARDEKA